MSANRFEVNLGVVIAILGILVLLAAPFDVRVWPHAWTIATPWWLWGALAIAFGTNQAAAALWREHRVWRKLALLANVALLGGVVAGFVLVMGAALATVAYGFLFLAEVGSFVRLELPRHAVAGK